MVLEKQDTPNRLTMLEIADPVPADDEIILKVRCCGVCHTDLHTVEGDITPPSLPVVPGHQIVGEVVGRGAEAGRFGIGDRVGAAWLRKSCGSCRYCRGGKENLCKRAEFNGFHANGGYAEFVSVPEAYVYPLPDVFDDMSAAPLLCAGIIGYRALNLSEIADGATLGLYGFGSSAHIALQIAVYRGCRVFVFSRSEEHRKLAQSLGAYWTGSVDDAVPEPISSSITFAPVGWMVERALGHLDRGGTLAINAVHMSPIPELPYERIYYERTIRSVANSTRHDAVEFLELAAKIPVQIHTTAFSLAEAGTALDVLKQGRMNGAGVLRVSGE